MVTPVMKRQSEGATSAFPPSRQSNVDQTYHQQEHVKATTTAASRRRVHVATAPLSPEVTRERRWSRQRQRRSPHGKRAAGVGDVDERRSTSLTGRKRPKEAGTEQLNPGGSLQNLEERGKERWGEETSTAGSKRALQAVSCRGRTKRQQQQQLQLCCAIFSLIKRY
ncbi:hypothetical protein MUK42_30776 [Musa troglodytarum]|uniref:Uncharacterized protein n=1 Tax=Musa troglodytarum TaxID=320322 RepID=A0A9E7EKE6_9LILI|nr:hypothetical protein MUK42_30776 [Musa troglodytarum]